MELIIYICFAACVIVITLCFGQISRYLVYDIEFSVTKKVNKNLDFYQRVFLNKISSIQPNSDCGNFLTIYFGSYSHCREAREVLKIKGIRFSYRYKFFNSHPYEVVINYGDLKKAA